MTTRPTWVWLLAMVAPAALIGASYSVLSAPAVLTPDPLVMRMDRAAKRRQMEVVLVGASYVDSNLDPKVLATSLGLQPGQVGRFGVRSSTAAVWYAVLKERVFANGLRPKLILLPVTLSSALSTALAGANARSLSTQMPEPDEVVLRRSYSSTLPRVLQRVVERRSRLRDPLLNRVQSMLPSAMLGADEDAVDAAGRAVFGEHHEGATARLLPVVEGDEDDAAAATKGLPNPEDSYLADIAALAKAHGARLVIVLNPVAPGTADDPGVDAETEGKVIEWANAQDVGYLDLRSGTFTMKDFLNGRHMNAEAARRFSETVAKELLAVDALGSGPFPDAVAPLEAPVAVRIGAAPPAPEVKAVAGDVPCSVVLDVSPFAYLGSLATERVGAGIVSPFVVTQAGRPLRRGPTPDVCDGTYVHRAKISVDALKDVPQEFAVAWSEEVPVVDEAGGTYHWVYPGTALEWSFPAVGGGGSAQVEVDVSALGSGGGSVEVGDSVVSLVVQDGRGRARVPVPTGTAWALRVRADTAFLLVTRVSVFAGDREQRVVEQAASPVQDLLRLPVSSAGDLPPAVPASLGQEAGHNYALAPWNDQAGCSPFLVAEDGVPLSGAKAAAFRKGGWRAAGVERSSDHLWFDTSDASDPRTNGRRYSVVYDGARTCGTKFCPTCGTRMWIYPGDVLDIAIPRRTRSALRSARFALELFANPDAVTTSEVRLSVEARLGDTPVADAVLSVTELLRGAVVPFTTLVPTAESRDVMLRLSLPSDSPPLLFSAALRAY